MKFILIIMVLCAGFWFLPSTRKIILENIVKQRTQKAFNKQMQRDLKKFTDEYKKTLKKGERAERELEYALKRRLNKKQWYVFENVTLPHGKGSTQIDLIALSVFGVFVIEVKEFSGKIYTNNTRSWYQYLGGKKFTFQNPHRQNYAHTEAVKKVFKGIQPENFHSLVAFLGTAKFKTLPENTYTSINAVIKELEKHTEPVIGIKTLLLAIGLMEYSRKYDLPETHEEHVAYLKEKHPELKEAA